MIDVQKLALEADLSVRDHEPIKVWEVDARDLERFAALVLEEAARKCDERAIDYAGLTEEQHASQACAAIVRALKPTYTPSEP